MAGSAVFSYIEAPDGKSIELTWIVTSDGSGDVSSPTVTQPGSTTYAPTRKWWGYLDQVTIVPGTSTVQPTDLFDVELRPSDNTGIDYLGGMGDNCSQTTTRIGTPLDEVSGVAFWVPGKALTVYAAAVGASKQFTISAVLRFKE